VRETVNETIQRELRLAGLFTDREPKVFPPHNLDAEAELCSAVLCGHAKTTEFAVRASDFYSVILAHVWIAVEAVAVLELEPTNRVILRALSESGYRGAEIEHELQQLRWQPFCLESRLHEHARKITELARRRDLMESIENLRRDLANGTTVTEARQVLAKLAGLG
jgi:hypothetical protein